MTEVPFDIPDSWRWATFGDVARVASNLVDPADHAEAPHIAPNHVESGTGRLLPYRTIAEDGVASPKHHFYPGQLVYSKIRPYLAKVVDVDFEGLCSADMYPVDVFIDRRFLFHWMLTPTFTAAAAGHQARTVLPKINERALLQILVPVPPLAEQRRIVAALEDNQSRLDAGLAPVEAGLRRSRLMTERLADRAVRGLSHGVSQRAVGLQPSGDELEEQVFRRARKRIEPDPMPGFDLPIGWASVSLGMLSYDWGYGTSTKCDYSAPGSPVLRIPNIQRGEVNLNDIKNALDESLDLSNYFLSPGDILFVRTNGSRDLIGRVAVVRQVLSMAFASYLIRFRLSTDLVEPGWIALVVSSSDWRRRLERAAASSAGQYNLNSRLLSSLPIPLPSVPMQRHLLQELGETTAVADRLSEALTLVKSKGLSLRRSLLGEAFAGRLVPQDPNDEPASKLLERIRAERAAAPPKQKTRRRTQKELPAPPTRVTGDNYQQEALPL
ncbi:hypothetical protein ACGFH8_04400 [Micromonospora sp. NPDC049175]|uniref:restriction endonuclease subunit S n=1 Tax=Micromonospora sp. NPDC049175 TaxID=3364266 RepID=UPI003714E7E5